MHRASRVVQQVFVLVCCLVTEGCAHDPGVGSTSRFEIKVIAENRAAIELQLSAQGAHLSRGPIFDGVHFYSVFEADSSLDDGGAPVRLATAGATLELAPYVCNGVRGYADYRQKGWSALETHEALLLGSGEWKVNTDFTRSLSYRCDLTDPERSNGEGFGSLFATPNRCDAADHAGSEVRVTSKGMPDVTPTECVSVHTDAANGNLYLQISFVSSEGEFTARWGYCFPEGGASFPVSLSTTAAWPDPACRAGTFGTWLPTNGSGPSNADAIEGSFVIATANLVDGGRQVSDVATTFRFSGTRTGEFFVQAHVESPVFRIHAAK